MKRDSAEEAEREREKSFAAINFELKVHKFSYRSTQEKPEPALAGFGLGSQARAQHKSEILDLNYIRSPCAMLLFSILLSEIGNSCVANRLPSSDGSGS